MDPAEEVPRPRGRGRPGYCEECGEWAPEGPDPCLGWIPGVAHACCGHGWAPAAFVFIGTPNREEPAGAYRHVILKEQDALEFFALIKRGQLVEPGRP